jgi:hypothetical protein
MVINNLDVLRVFVPPTKADAPSLIYAEAELPGPAALQGCQPIAGRQPQVAQLARTVQLRELPQGFTFHLQRQAVVEPALP